MLLLDPHFGLEECVRLWDLHDRKGTPVLLANAFHLHELLEESRRHGIEHYLLEPILEGDLLRLIEKTGVVGSLVRQEPTLLPSAKWRILLAEDNPVNRRVASGILRKEGHELVEAVDGAEALELYRSREFDLVLMDVQMPRMDGYEATKRIRSWDAAMGRHTPILALTAHAMSGDRDLCVRAGMDDYITKPVQANILIEKIAQLAGRVAIGRRVLPQ